MKKKRVSQKFLKELNASVIRVGRDGFFLIDKIAALPTSSWQVPWVDREVVDESLGRAVVEGLHADAAAIVGIPTSFLRYTEGIFVELSFRPDKPTKVGLIGRDGLVGVLPFCKRNLFKPFAAGLHKDFVFGLFPRERKLTLELVPWGRAGLEYIWRIKPGPVLYAPVMGDKLKEIEGWPTSLRDV